MSCYAKMISDADKSLVGVDINAIIDETWSGYGSRWDGNML